MIEIEVSKNHGGDQGRRQAKTSYRPWWTLRALGGASSGAVIIAKIEPIDARSQH
jgi:hypothetical protein